MDQDEKPPPLKRQSRFKPKAPLPRKPKLVNPKREEEDNDEFNEATKALLQRLRVNEHQGKGGIKVGKKSSVQVAFANGIGSSGQIRSFGLPKQGNNNISLNSSGSTSKSSVDDEKITTYSPSTAIQQDGTNLMDIVESSSKKKKTYKEPWDYNHSYYPTTLPLRRPYSGNPELLDLTEFGETPEDSVYDESIVNPASELGLLECNDEPQMLFLQLPNTLPFETLLEKRTSKTAQKEKGKEKVGISKPPIGANDKGKHKVGASSGANEKGKEKVDERSGLEKIPKGHMGKLLVYKSGAIKWKIGEVVYDVAPGVGCNFAQNVVAMNTAEKHACTLGEVGKRAVVSLDINSLFNNNLNLDIL